MNAMGDYMEKKISVGTITRTVLLILALINQLLTVFGKSPLPFDDETITQLVSLGFTIATSILSWWKNNSFTWAAIKADGIMNELKGK